MLPVSPESDKISSVLNRGSLSGLAVEQSAVFTAVSAKDDGLCDGLGGLWQGCVTGNG